MHVGVCTGHVWQMPAHSSKVATQSRGCWQSGYRLYAEQGHMLPSSFRGQPELCKTVLNHRAIGTFGNFCQIPKHLLTGPTSLELHQHTAILFSRKR